MKVRGLLLNRTQLLDDQPALKVSILMKLVFWQNSEY